MFEELEEKLKTTFVLPLASIIETGNHIAQSSNLRYETALKLAELMKFLSVMVLTASVKFRPLITIWTGSFNFTCNSKATHLQFLSYLPPGLRHLLTH